jgi:hypothetical protein
VDNQDKKRFPHPMGRENAQKNSLTSLVEEELGQLQALLSECSPPLNTQGKAKLSRNTVGMLIKEILSNVPTLKTVLKNVLTADQWNLVLEYS